MANDFYLNALASTKIVPSLRVHRAPEPAFARNCCAGLWLQHISALIADEVDPIPRKIAVTGGI
jgi:hypothetical protein